MSRQRQFDLLVFDWDGTLFDSTGLIVQCIQEACHDLKISIPTDQAARQVIGLELAIALQRAVPDLPQALYPDLVERYRHHYFGHQDKITLYDGVPEFLQHCRERGYMLAVATGKGRRGLNAALESIGLKSIFDDTRTADETASKPNPLMLNELMQVLDTPAQKTLMVGDTTHDIQMAVNAGVPSLAITHGAHSRQELSRYSAEQGLLGVVDSITGMQDWLSQRG